MPALSAKLAGLDHWKGCQFVVPVDGHDDVPMVTVEFHEAWMEEWRLRLDREVDRLNRIAEVLGV